MGQVRRHPVDGLPAVMSVSDAQIVINEFVRRFNTLNLDEISSCFADDVVVDYAGQPVMNGIQALRAFMQQRYASVADYSLRKSVRCLTGAVVGVDATVIYRDTSTDSWMAGRAFEFLTLRDGVIARWDNVAVYRQSARD